MVKRSQAFENDFHANNETHLIYQRILQSALVCLADIPHLIF